MFYRPDRRCVPQGALWVSARGQAFHVLLYVFHVLLSAAFMFYRPPPVGACPWEPSGYLLRGGLFMFYFVFFMFYWEWLSCFTAPPRWCGPQRALWASARRLAFHVLLDVSHVLPF